jgi:RND family efflux transporter MFP subunit
MKNTILKFATIILLAGVIVACGSGDSNESIQQQIKDYKDEVSQLNIKIKELEQELEDRNVNEDEFITPVKVSNVKLQPFHHYFQVSGTVDADENAFISPEINGQVKEVLVSEGDRVKKGELLVRLNTSITENTIEEVKTQLELASTLYEKQKQLWEKNIGSEVQYLQAKNNKESLKSKMQTLQAQLDMAYIKSPIDGIVDAIFIEAGELAMPGMQMIQVINLKSLNVKADVSEKYLPVIKKGDMVNLSFPTYPDLKMDVKVHRTGEVVKLGNRTFTVELKIDNVDGKLKPNILALMRFLDFSDEAAIVVPSIIIKKDIVGEYIYVVRNVDESKVAKKVYISTGLSYNDETMVTDGINTGDVVITEGYSLVTDGTEVKVI